ncbi:MAG: hypothetical protein WAT19_08025 [Ferruginibacter sp.]
MKKIFVLSLTLFIGSVLFAQNKTASSLEYKTAAGIKIWDGVGLSLKTFIQEKAALEFIGFFNSDGVRITGLYEFHGDLNSEGNLKWYVGPGAHVGLYKGNNTLFGVDGVLGLDYKFNELPLNIALDWQPSFEFSKGYGFAGGWGGLGVRYTF